MQRVARKEGTRRAQSGNLKSEKKFIGICFETIPRYIPITEHIKGLEVQAYLVPTQSRPIESILALLVFFVYLIVAYLLRPLVGHLLLFVE